MGCTIFAVLAAQGFGADLRATLFRKVQSFPSATWMSWRPASWSLA